MDRRSFTKSLLFSGLTPLMSFDSFTRKPEHHLRISLAQWSLNRSIRSGNLSPLDFAKKSRNLEIDAIEYVSGLYTDHSDILEKMSMDKLSKELLKRSNDYGIDNILIMIDGQGDLATSNRKKRLKALDQHKKWIDFASFLGCSTLRLNLYGEQNLIKWTDNSVQSMSNLCNYNKQINIVVENHGGFSSNGKYLSKVIQKVNSSNFGSLPDFGNFCIDGWPSNCLEWYDKYLGVEELMPYAHAVSAKSYDFDSSGNETTIDYKRMIDIVKKAGYKGYVGIEYEGNRMSEDDGIIATKKLLEKLI